MDKKFVLPPRRRFTPQEKRRNAEVSFSRWSWLGGEDSDTGLRMAHKLKEQDSEMRWLADLFPLQEGILPDYSTVAEKRLSEWCAEHPGDARALWYLAMVREDELLIEKAAAMGDSRATAEMCCRTDDQYFLLAWAAVERGDADGTFYLMHCFRNGIGCKCDDSIADELMERAIDLGSFRIYYDLARDLKMDPVVRVKRLISFSGMYSSGSVKLHADLKSVLEDHAADGRHADVIFEVGEMFKGTIDYDVEKMFGPAPDLGIFKTLLRAVALYDDLCDAARDACVAWILIAKRLGLNKDVRRMIARMVWEARRKAR